MKPFFRAVSFIFPDDEKNMPPVFYRHLKEYKKKRRKDKISISKLTMAHIWGIIALEINHRGGIIMRKFKKEISLFLVAAMTMLMLQAAAAMMQQQTAAQIMAARRREQRRKARLLKLILLLMPLIQRVQELLRARRLRLAQSALPPEALRFTVLLFRTELTLP